MSYSAETFLSRLDKTSPLAIRLAVQRRGRRPTMAELLSKSAMRRRTFQRIAYATSWADVPAKHISQFAKAFGVDLFHKQPLKEFARAATANNLSHLTTRQRKKADAVVRKLMEGK